MEQRVGFGVPAIVIGHVPAVKQYELPYLGAPAIAFVGVVLVAMALEPPLRRQMGAETYDDLSDVEQALVFVIVSAVATLAFVASFAVPWWL